MSLVIHPEDTKVELGSSVLLHCVSYGAPPAPIIWSKDGITLSNDSKITITEWVVSENGLTFVRSAMELCSAEVADGGIYSCTADNGITNDGFSFDVTIVGGRLCKVAGVPRDVCTVLKLPRNTF